jgi:hypothetical protein
MPKRKIWAMLIKKSMPKSIKNRHKSVRIIKQWVLRCPPEKKKKK